MTQRANAAEGKPEGTWLTRLLPRDNTRAYIILLIFAIPVPVFWLFHRFDVNRMLGFEAVALAVAAVLIAILHTTKLEGVAEDLHDVSRSLPTRTVGVFPSYLPEVVESSVGPRRASRSSATPPRMGRSATPIPSPSTGGCFVI